MRPRTRAGGPGWPPHAAITSAAVVVSVARPGPPAGMGGPSVAFAPSGEPLLESGPSPPALALVDVGAEVLAVAGCTYPGYLRHPVEPLAAGWAGLRLAGSG